MTAGIVAESRWPVAQQARCAGRDPLALLLREARARTLRLADAYEAALGPLLPVPMHQTLNPPLWELGHIGWFADRWIARHPARHLGERADPDAPLLPARQAARGVDADALYDSSAVPHAIRWHLPLPDLPTTRADLQDSLDETLALLAQADESDAGLYMFRLALFHEAMHAEAWVYMAQTLGIDAGEPPPATGGTGSDDAAQLAVDGACWAQGWAGPGFAFDNEREGATVALEAFRIDAHPVSWARYLPALEAAAVPVPRDLRREGGQWWQCAMGRWMPLDPMAPACHLTLAEAEAWCRWAGRRLPTEAEWELAAHTAPGFEWGRVWEWTASAFAPLPGFVPHPYRDYSRPWFDGRPVLKGASQATADILRHPRYRNFFEATRSDIFSGFRSVALG